jgi:tetratricopeptide (TPR) repeat protein
VRPIALFVVLALLGCEKASPAPVPSNASSAPSAAIATDPISPPTQASVPTTDGSIAWGNLRGQIRGAERMITSPRDVDERVLLAELIGARGQFAADPADYERALALCEEAVAGAPKLPAPLVARAAARSTLHLFDAALADLDAAEKLGASAATTRPTRASIAQARGDLDAALALRVEASRAYPNINTLGAESALLLDLGRVDAAQAKLQAAFASYRDVAPFPVVWLLFQHAAAWERQGNPRRAKAFYAAAHERLPAYALATAHLARLEQPDVAVVLVQQLATDCADPEPEVVLAEMLKKQGKKAEFDAHVAHVRERYDALVAKHPEAYADHAAWFFLDDAGDAARALTLAKQNLAVRPNEKSYELAILAALSADKKSDACGFYAEAEKRGRATSMLKGIAGQACSK